MRKFTIIAALLATTGAFTGCAKTSWINDISVSPDGKRIDVVGAQMQQFYGGWIVKKPLRWVCIRDASGTLKCDYMSQQLPTMP
jgi:hypothetical protein